MASTRTAKWRATRAWRVAGRSEPSRKRIVIETHRQLACTPRPSARAKWHRCAPPSGANSRASRRPNGIDTHRQVARPAPAGRGSLETVTEANRHRHASPTGVHPRVGRHAPSGATSTGRPRIARDRHRSQPSSTRIANWRPPPRRPARAKWRRRAPPSGATNARQAADRSRPSQTQMASTRTANWRPPPRPPARAKWHRRAPPTGANPLKSVTKAKWHPHALPSGATDDARSRSNRRSTRQAPAAVRTHLSRDLPCRPRRTRPGQRVPYRRSPASPRPGTM